MPGQLNQMLELQRKLQLNMPPPNRVPADLRGDARASFMVWNAYALTDEIHEAIAEMGWKPWATSRHFNAQAMLKEMVDAWHFFMNMLLVIGGEMEWSIDELADQFFAAYVTKNQVNSQRQEQGYDGLSSKCVGCNRELTETDSHYHWTEDGKTFHSYQCMVDWRMGSTSG